MFNISSRRKYKLSLVLPALLAIGGIVAQAQDLVPVGSIAGGSSVFVFRSSVKAAPRKYVSKTKTRRSSSQRKASARKVNSQYARLSKAKPRRVRSNVVEPNKLPPEIRIKTMPKNEVSVIFAGVGEYYVNQNNLDEAISFFREAVTLDPKNKKATDGLSEVLALKGNDVLLNDSPQIAQTFFTEALTLNAENSPAYYGLGEVYSALDDDQKAIENYEKALRYDSELTEIYVPLGILYYQRGNPGDIEKADPMLTKALLIDAESSQTQYFLGLIRLGQNREQEALAAFTKAKTLDPNYTEAFISSGDAHMRLAQPAEAEADYTKATTLEADSFEAWFGLGTALQVQSRYDEAAKAYKRASELKNDNSDVFLNLGDVYRQLGKYNDAEANYNLAVLFLERQPNYDKTVAADIYSNIGFVIARQCEINTQRAVPCKWPVAVKALEKAVALSGTNIDYANLGWAYYNGSTADLAASREAKKNGRTAEADSLSAESRAKLEKAKTNLQRAVDTDPKFVIGPLMNLGMVLTDLGDYAGAAEALKKVVKVEPDWVFALNELGIAYRKQEKYGDAIEQFKLAIKRDDKYAIAYYNLAEAEYRNGNLGNAKKAYQSLLKLKRRDLAGQLELLTSGAIAQK